eukprot:GHVT01084330.1.p1 GENE.GHVT01084330.1~~GHVT01084330.1.p1  ORF type:complete len:184 (+),score=3.44 GHVT01084330.1:2816-3367(+)
MGSQTSTSRHQALGDVPQGRISGLRPVLSREFADDNLHVGANAGGTAGVAERGGAGEGHLPPYQRLSTGVLSSPDDGDELIPCLFSWSHGGHNVYLTGSFNEWSVENKIRLVRSGHEFSAVQMLLRGVHLYKFIGTESTAGSRIEWHYWLWQRTCIKNRYSIALQVAVRKDVETDRTQAVYLI